MTVFAMVTTERSKAYTEHALRTFYDSTPFGGSDAFLLIDNDASYDLPADLQNPALELRRNAQPLGFAANANVAIREALSRKSDLVFLNNDLIFVPDWYKQFEQDLEAVLVPYSNKELHYTVVDAASNDTFTFGVDVELEDYLQHEKCRPALAAAHHQRSLSSTPFLEVVCAAFFAVRLPLPVMTTLGGFDLRYGIGGAEDYDYCLRAHLAGFHVRVAQHAYLLHFGSRSIGTANEPVRKARETFFLAEFAGKWGERLRDLVFTDDPQIIEHLQLPRYDYQREGFRRVVEAFLPPAVPKLSMPIATI